MSPHLLSLCFGARGGPLKNGSPRAFFSWGYALVPMRVQRIMIHIQA